LAPLNPSQSETRGAYRGGRLSTVAQLGRGAPAHELRSCDARCSVALKKGCLEMQSSLTTGQRRLVEVAAPQPVEREALVARRCAVVVLSNSVARSPSVHLASLSAPHRGALGTHAPLCQGVPRLFIKSEGYPGAAQALSYHARAGEGRRAWRTASPGSPTPLHRIRGYHPGSTEIDARAGGA
jgi:hypothetical protein